MARLTQNSRSLDPKVTDHALIFGPDITWSLGSPTYVIRIWSTRPSLRIHNTVTKQEMNDTPRCLTTRHVTFPSYLGMIRPVRVRHQRGRSAHRWGLNGLTFSLSSLMLPFLSILPRLRDPLSPSSFSLSFFFFLHSSSLSFCSSVNRFGPSLPTLPASHHLYVRSRGHFGCSSAHRLHLHDGRHSHFFFKPRDLVIGSRWTVVPL